MEKVENFYIRGCDDEEDPFLLCVCGMMGLKKPANRAEKSSVANQGRKKRVPLSNLRPWKQNAAFDVDFIANLLLMRETLGS